MESVCSSCQDNQPTMNSELSEAGRAGDAFLTVPGREEGQKIRAWCVLSLWGCKDERMPRLALWHGTEVLDWKVKKTFCVERFLVIWTVKILQSITKSYGPVLVQCKNPEGDRLTPRTFVVFLVRPVTPQLCGCIGLTFYIHIHMHLEWNIVTPGPWWKLLFWTTL